MNGELEAWSAEPLVWGDGPILFEVFLEPTCPFSARAFQKIDDLLSLPNGKSLSVRIWLHSQPWHLFSGIVCRAILAASTTREGKVAARKVMETVFANREAFEFDDHRAGPNLQTTPNALLERIEALSGVAVSDAFQISGLERELKIHTRYARQNGIHMSPTFMVDGLIDPAISSGDSVEAWADRILKDA